MKKYNFLEILLFSLFFLACKSETAEFQSKQLNILRKIDLQQNFGGFTIDQSVNKYCDHYIIFDRANQNVLLVDLNFSKVFQEFDLKNTLLESAPLYGFDILENKLFLRTSSGFAVYNLDNNQLIGTFKNPFPLSNHLLRFKGKNFATVVSESSVTVVNFLWDDEKGFVDIKEVVAVPTKRLTIDVDLSGWLFGLKNSLAYIDDWSGEYTLLDIDRKEIIKQGRLPLGGPLEENYEIDESNIYSGNYKNAYSLTQLDDSSFFILREVDWEISTATEIDLSLESDKMRIRKRVHLFDQDFEIIRSFQLENFATSIFYDNGKLIANHSGDEEFYVYEILD